MARLVRLDDNAISLLEQIKEEMRKKGIEKVTYSETVRYLARQVEIDNKTKSN